MRRMVCALPDSILLLTGTGMTSYGAAINGISAVGLGVKANVGEDDSLNLDVVSPIIEPVEKYSFEQMEADIQALQQTYGDRTTVNMIGASRDGRNICDIIPGSPQVERQVLIQGAIHVREYMTPLLMMGQLEYALTSYDTGHYNVRKIGGMPKKVATHLVLMISPDGATLNQFGVGAIRLEELEQTIRECYDRDTQMNRATDTSGVYLAKWRVNAAEVNLNYNFPAGWNELSTKLTAPPFTSYRGSSPFSEPGTQVLEKLMGQCSWAITISYHSRGEVIYWITGESGAKMASNILADPVSVMTDYRVDNSDGKGGFKGWMQSWSKVVPGVTTEMGETPCSAPFEEFVTVWKQNKGVWVQALDYMIRRMQPCLLYTPPSPRDS